MPMDEVLPPSAIKNLGKFNFISGNPFAPTLDVIISGRSRCLSLSDDKSHGRASAWHEPGLGLYWRQLCVLFAAEQMERQAASDNHPVIFCLAEEITQFKFPQSNNQQFGKSSTSTRRKEQHT
ncbi:uncharacterized protein LOC133393631 [Anopheles gambiae]|uniref:uncharacterized protein LOC133393631 n=1 Tax=Anopheles gambiae TaxID=7165 RepID=UPI002AC9334D|nr:uncharacterized protein LOC133393631 [Anopheles gambiae]